MDSSELNFEDALERLESVVGALEGGELGLDDALAQYEQGVRLLVRCRALLENAERKVALLTGVDEDGSPLTAPFDATATAEQPSKVKVTDNSASRPERRRGGM
jgi:exodeoxyribonuclease VII small subunit